MGDGDGTRNGGRRGKESRTLSNQDLIARHIEPNPKRPGEDRAQLRDFGGEVWALIAYYQDGAHGDLEAVARAYDVPREMVEAALAYYQQHRDAIDALLKRLRTA